LICHCPSDCLENESWLIWPSDKESLPIFWDTPLLPGEFPVFWHITHSIDH